jgi:hypothetical protein
MTVYSVTFLWEGEEREVRAAGQNERLCIRLAMVRENKRKVRRRKARANLELGERRGLTQEEALGFFQAIDQKRSSVFSAVKLSTIDLNKCYAPPDRKLEHPRFNVWNDGGKMTLIAYAAYRKRDEIVASLLQAGADPSVVAPCEQFATPCSTASLYLRKEPTPYAVWIIRRIVHGRCLAGVHLQSSKYLACWHCSRSAAVSPLCLCNLAHAICESCFWEAQECKSVRAGELTCPYCVPQMCPSGDSVAAESPPCLETRIRRSCATRAMYMATPESLNIKGYKIAKKKKFRGLTMRECMKLDPGVIQSERTERLFQATMQGNAPRVEALVELGVDVRARGTFGETCLFLAAWLGHRAVTRALLDVSSQEDVWFCAQLSTVGEGVNLQDVLRSRGRQNNVDTVLQVFHEYGHFMEFAVGVTKSQSCGYKKYATTAKLTLANFFEGTAQRLRVTLPLVSFAPSEATAIIDQAFSADFMDHLREIHRRLEPVDLSPTKHRSFSQTFAVRYLFCDWAGSICKCIENVLDHAAVHDALFGEGGASARARWKWKVNPMMRFICYIEEGGGMPIHTDLAKMDSQSGKKSTHTFMLHLNSMTDGGGETAFYAEAKEKSTVLALAEPASGRLVIFPHNRPHAGLIVKRREEKLFLRGELQQII